MMQTQWPEPGSRFDFPAFETSLGGGDSYAGPTGAFPRAQPLDSVARPWWTSGTGTATSNPNGGPLSALFNTANGSNTSIAGILTGLVSLLQQLVGSFLNQNANQTRPQQPQHQHCAALAPQQRFENVDVSSTGDPHLAAVGTPEGPGRSTRTGTA